jgi:hypothetical protein
MQRHAGVKSFFDIRYPRSFFNSSSSASNFERLGVSIAQDIHLYRAARRRRHDGGPKIAGASSIVATRRVAAIEHISVTVSTFLSVGLSPTVDQQIR